MRLVAGTRPLALALAATAVAATGAAAATLGGLATGGLGAGQASVTACDPDGFTITQVLSATTVTDLIVGDIHSACAGGVLVVTLVDVSNAVVGEAGPTTVPGGGGSVTVAVTPTPDTAVVDRHLIRIVGP